MSKAPSWEEIERDYFATPGNEEFHGCMVVGVVEHWDHRLVKVERGFNSEKEAIDYLDDLQASINKEANRWPKFWWRQFTMKAHLKLYKFDRVVNIKELSKWSIGRPEEERKGARRIAGYLLALAFAIIAYCVYRMLLQCGIL